MATGALLALMYQHWPDARPGSSDEAVAPTPTMRAWFDQTRPSIDGVVNARNNISAAASRRDIAATGTACRAAAEAVTNLRGHLPSPKAAVNDTLQQAISSYAAGLPNCISASHAVGGEGMQRAASYISQGDKAMQLALDILGDEADPALGKPGLLIV